MTAPSTAPRLARQATRLEAAMTVAVAQLTAAVPALTSDAATAVLQAATPTGGKGAARTLEDLAAHLAAHPDGLKSGDSRCPPALLRLTHLLHEAGQPVIRPSCAYCGRITSSCGGFDPRAASAAPATPIPPREVRTLRARRRTHRRSHPGREALLPLLPPGSRDLQ